MKIETKVKHFLQMLKDLAYIFKCHAGVGSYLLVSYVLAKKVQLTEINSTIKFHCFN